MLYEWGSIPVHRNDFSRRFCSSGHHYVGCRLARPPIDGIRRPNLDTSAVERCPVDVLDRHTWTVHTGRGMLERYTRGEACLKISGCFFCLACLVSGRLLTDYRLIYVLWFNSCDINRRFDVFSERRTVAAMFSKKKKKPEISQPSEFEHRVHTGYDPVRRTFVGLPSQWNSVVEPVQTHRPRPIVDPSSVTPMKVRY